MDEMTGMEALSRTPRTETEDDRRARAELKPRADLLAMDLPPEAMDAIKDLQARLTKLEARDTRGLLGKLLGKGSVAALLLAVFLISGTAWAQYTAFGAGNKSCSGWVTAEDEHYSVVKRAQFYGWIRGYLTAYSLWVERGSGPVSSRNSSASARAWVANYCRNHPRESVAKTAERMIDAIKAE